MLCENCKENTAVIHYNYSLNGHMTDIHLCQKCAYELGLSDIGSANKNDLFTGLFGDWFGTGKGIGQNGYNRGTSVLYNKEKVCPSCGMSETEVRKNGRFGCAECYHTFSSLVVSMLEKLHLSSEHRGRVPVGINCSESVERKIESLTRQMNGAVSKQDYEEAARLRDAIKLLEDNKSGGFDE